MIASDKTKIARNMFDNYILKSNCEIFNLGPIPAMYLVFNVFASGAHLVRVKIVADETKIARKLLKNNIL